MEQASPPGAPPTKKRRRRTVLKVSAAVFVVLLLAAGGIAYWILDRYVIDHVVIDDVAAYEQAQSTAVPAAKAGPNTATTAAPPTAATPPTTTATATTAGPPSTAAPVAPVVTADSYTSDNLKVTISKHVEGSGNDTITYFVADVVVSDARQLRSGFAENKFGQNIIEDTSVIANRYNAVFAINGDYYGYRDSGILIRNGVLYRDEGARTGLALFQDGTMRVYDEKTTSGQELLAAGVWNTMSFGPALVNNGVIPDGIERVEVDTNIGNHSIQGQQPRTGLGMISANHFIFIAVDGRSRGYSRGVTMTEFAQLFKDHGATTAYNVDGGGSTTMVFNGAVVNDPLGKGAERGTSDIFYFAGTAS